VLLCISMTGCQGSIGGNPDDSAPPPPDVTPKDVPSNPEVLSGEGFCTPLLPGEKLLSTSPEGHAWLVSSDSGSSTTIRVLDAFDSTSEVSESVDLAAIDYLHAWSDGDAAVLADDGLWRLEQLARVQLTPPEGFGSQAAMCGDPGTNGSILVSGKLFERRDDEQWWGWDPATSGDATPTDLLRFEGDCQGTDDILWMTSPDGTLWRVEPTQVFRPVRFDALRGGAVTARPGVDGGNPSTMLAILDADSLWVGPDAWERWLFPGATPKQIHASGGYLWMTSGSQLLRYDGSAWNEVSHGHSGPVAQLAPHANGVWLVGSSEICHVAPGPMLRIDGVRPHVRSKDLDYDIAVLASDASDITATIAGEAIPLSLDMETGWLEGVARIDQVGWAELLLTTPTASRSLAIKRLPEQQRSWAVDIEPIYAANCTGADCHQPGATTGPPDLSTYEAWTTLSTQIRTRVVDAMNMPPAANQGPDWGDEQVAIIADWLEGGLLP
jgi:hypothetical protein